MPDIEATVTIELRRVVTVPASTPEQEARDAIRMAETMYDMPGWTPTQAEIDSGRLNVQSAEHV